MWIVKHGPMKCFVRLDILPWFVITRRLLLSWKRLNWNELVLLDDDRNKSWDDEKISLKMVMLIFFTLKFSKWTISFLIQAWHWGSLRTFHSGVPSSNLGILKKTFLSQCVWWKSNKIIYYIFCSGWSIAKTTKSSRVGPLWRQWGLIKFLSSLTALKYGWTW